VELKICGRKFAGITSGYRFAGYRFAGLKQIKELIAKCLFIFNCWKLTLYAPADAFKAQASLHTPRAWAITSNEHLIYQSFAIGLKIQEL
jgi:hypothetical protein